MVALAKPPLEPIVVIELDDRGVEGEEGLVWNVLLGIEKDGQHVPALRAYERGTGGAMDYEALGPSKQQRALADEAMAVLLHWCERDKKRAQSDTPAASWVDSLVAEMADAHAKDGSQIDFHGARFHKNPIPLKKVTCRCGVEIDRSKNGHARTCSEKCFEEEQFEIHLALAREREPGLSVEDFDWLPWENHVPDLQKVIDKIELSVRKGAWPISNPKLVVRRINALESLRAAQVLIEAAKDELKALRLAWDQHSKRRKRR